MCKVLSGCKPVRVLRSIDVLSIDGYFKFSRVPCRFPVSTKVNFGLLVRVGVWQLSQRLFEMIKKLGNLSHVAN